MSAPGIEPMVAVTAQRLLGLMELPSHYPELLGLGPDPASWDQQAVSRALLDRLHRIDEHPQARTPEADELRVALHVAAARLRDPDIRAQLASDGASSQLDPVEAPLLEHPLTAPSASEVGQAAAPVGVAMPDTQRVNDDFRVAAEHVLASCGGWNAESKRRLGYLARSASVDAGGLQQTLVAITRQHEQPGRVLGQGSAPNGQPASGDYSSASTLSRASLSARPLDHRVSSPRARTWMTIGTAIMLVSSGVIGMGLLTLVVQELMTPQKEIQTNVISGTAPGSTKAPGNSSPTPQGNSGTTDLPVDNLSQPPIAADGPALVRYLQTLDAGVFDAAPQETLASLEDVYSQLASQWVPMPEDMRSTAMLALRDAILAASEASSTAGTSALEPLLRDLDPLDSQERNLDPRALTRAVFAYGAASLLLDTPIPPKAERDLRTRLNSIASLAGGGLSQSRSFHERSKVALRVITGQISPRPADTDEQTLLSAWSTWVVMARSLGTIAATETILDALEGLAVDGENPAFHQPTSAVIALLVRAVDWASDPDRLASTRLLAWFDDHDGVPDSVLSVITAEFVDGGLLPGLDAAMKLASGGSGADRTALRDQYALRLSHPQIGEGRAFASEWVGFAEELIDSGLPQDHRGVLDRAVRAARLNEAAALWIAADEDAARSAMERARITLEEITANAGGPVPFGTRGPARADGEWAAKYLLARRNADERTRLLYELGNTGGPAGEADADVLAETASYSTPLEIRKQAQAIVMAHADNPAMIMGLLEVSPRAAEQQNVSLMYETVTGRTLPDVDDQRWRVEVRRALVARLLELLVDSDQRYLDVANGVLADTVRTRSSILQTAADRTGGSDLDAIEDSMRSSDAGIVSDGLVEVAARYIDLLERSASKYPQRAVLFAGLSEIESRRVWRERLAGSDTGMYAAQTTSVFELVAYVFGCERPADAASVNRIVSEAATARRNATSSYQQIAVNELAILRINILRLGGEL